jgi:hypothetical protein
VLDVKESVAQAGMEYALSATAGTFHLQSVLCRTGPARGSTNEKKKSNKAEKRTHH